MAAMNNMSGAMVGAAGGAMPGGPAVDYVKLYRSERENLEITEYSWIGEDVEERVLEMFKHRSKRVI